MNIKFVGGDLFKLLISGVLTQFLTYRRAFSQILLDSMREELSFIRELTFLKEKLSDLDLDNSRELAVSNQLKYQVHGLVELIHLSIMEQKVMNSILASLNFIDKQYLYKV